VPSWLNLDNPRVKIVTHEEIFLNKSTLPTFSSPAIETHLHRIPGISDKFLYFNDDVLFGRTVSPDAFWTHAYGQKVFLAWAVPSAPWGGGNWQNSNWQGGTGWQNRGNSDACAPGCADGWIGDKFCDRACNTHECGFDAGDCGTDVMLVGQMAHVYVNSQTGRVLVPAGVPAMFLNISSLYKSGTVTDAYYDNDDKIRSSIIAKQVLTFVFPRWVISNMSHHVNVSLTVELTPSKSKQLVQFVLEMPPYNETMAWKPPVTSAAITSAPLTSTPAPSTAAFSGFGGNRTAVNGSTSGPYNRMPLRSAVNGTVPLNPMHVAVVTPESQRILQSRDPVLMSDTHAAPPIPESQQIIKSANQLRSDVPFQSVVSVPATARKPELQQLLQPSLHSATAGQSSSLPVFGHHVRTKPKRFQAPALKHSPISALNSSHMIDHVRDKVSHGKDWPQGQRSEAMLDALEVSDTLRDPSTNERQRRLLRIAHRKADLESSSSASLSPLSGERTSRRLTTTRTPYLRMLPSSSDSSSDKLTQIVEFYTKGTKGQHPQQQNAFKPQLLPSTRKSSNRQLLDGDAFGDSLRTVDDLFTTRYGAARRSVPAHMPHLIDKAIIADLQSWYPQDFARTSSHRFRSGSDMQFAFSYFYFMMNEPTGESHEAFLQSRIDLDGNGFLSGGELRLLATHLYNPVQLNDLNEMFWQAVDSDVIGSDKEAGLAITKLYLDESSQIVALQDILLAEEQGFAFSSNKQTKTSTASLGKRKEALTQVFQHDGIPIAWVVASKSLSDKMEKALEHVPKYKHEMGDTNQVAFHMVGDKEDEVNKQLDSIRRGNPYFVCINDNMNKSAPNPAVISSIHQFYTTLLPEPSQFEHPVGVVNPFLHVDEMPEKQDSQFEWWTAFFGFAVLTCVLWCVWTVALNKCTNRQVRHTRVINPV